MVRHNRLHPVINTTKEPTTVSFPTTVRITKTHINEMYDRYDSGMCDRRSCNAVSLALSETLSKPVRIDTINGERHLIVGGQEIELPVEISDWLEKAEHGTAAEPIEFGLPSY